jgi:hypothetical protein
LAASRVELARALIERLDVDDHHVYRLAASDPVGNGLPPFAHRRPPDRIDLVSGPALELREEIAIGLRETGEDHHLDLHCRGDARREQQYRTGCKTLFAQARVVGQRNRRNLGNFRGGS